MINSIIMIICVITISIICINIIVRFIVPMVIKIISLLRPVGSGRPGSE